MTSIPTTDDPIAEPTIKRVMWKILPLLVACYVVSFIDRVNLGFASSHFQSDLGFTSTLFGFGAGIFAIGYFLFEVPSNLILHKVGARLWIARIMVTWGLVSAGFAFVEAEWSFVALRFLLGVAEAGFFPGIILYLSLWFPRRALARATAIFILGLPAAMLIGAPLSTGIISTLHDAAGLRGWQWMFILEGLCAVLIGSAVFLLMTDEPKKAAWLTEPQRHWLMSALAAERSAKESVRHYGVAETLRNRKVLILSACIFCNITALFGITLWMPQIIDGFGGLTTTTSGLLTAVPYLFAAVAMMANARHSDVTGERRWHIAIPAAAGAIGLVLAVAAPTPVWGMAGLCLGAAGILSSNILFWGIPSMFLTGAAAAAGIAMVNSIGNLGGFVGPYLTGWAKDLFGSFSAGMYVLAGLALLYGLSTFAYLTANEPRLDDESETIVADAA
ncbi:MFS transporter [Nocardia carnea]|uniref:MFS transporter n=1 Tax=Nocardia carnea TaxID=37328 RepID=UPI002455B26F|nr:MFS transporter [Nocardia carnea]